MGRAWSLANITFPTPVTTNSINPTHNFQFGDERSENKESEEEEAWVDSSYSKSGRINGRDKSLSPAVMGVMEAVSSSKKVNDEEEGLGVCVGELFPEERDGGVGATLAISE